MTYTTEQLEAMLAAATPGRWDRYCIFVCTGIDPIAKQPARYHPASRNWDANASLIAAAPTITAELIAARCKLDAVTAERDESQTDLAKVIMSLPPGKGERAAGAVDGVKMMRARLDAKLDAVDGLVDALNELMDGNHWRIGQKFDPNSGNFSLSTQRAALAAWDATK